MLSFERLKTFCKTDVPASCKRVHMTYSLQINHFNTIMPLVQFDGKLFLA